MVEGCTEQPTAWMQQQSVEIISAAKMSCTCLYIGVGTLFDVSMSCSVSWPPARVAIGSCSASSRAQHQMFDHDNKHNSDVQPILGLEHARSDHCQLYPGLGRSSDNPTSLTWRSSVYCRTLVFVLFLVASNPLKKS